MLKNYLSRTDMKSDRNLDLLKLKDKVYRRDFIQGASLGLCSLACTHFPILDSSSVVNPETQTNFFGQKSEAKNLGHFRSK